MAKEIDIIDVMTAVNNGKLKVMTKNGFYMLEHIESGERVRLNESEVNGSRQGRWIKTGAKNIYGGIEVVCSECSHEMIIAPGHVSSERYCCYCGIRMTNLYEFEV